MNRQQVLPGSLNHLVVFSCQVLPRFRLNQGLLLSGAVAYYTLLSIVPMSILSLVVLTHFIEEQQLILTLSTYLNMMIPTYAGMLIKHMQAFIEHRRVVGMIGIFVMQFFSSLALDRHATMKTARLPRRRTRPVALWLSPRGHSVQAAQSPPPGPGRKRPHGRISLRSAP